MNKIEANYLPKYLVYYGLILGFSIVFIIYFWGLIYFDHPFTIAGIKFLHNQLPFLYFLDLIPFLFGLTCYFWGYKFEQMFGILNTKFQFEVQKSNKVLEFTNNLINDQ